MSSLVIPQGYSVELFKDGGNQGTSIVINGPRFASYDAT